MAILPPGDPDDPQMAPGGAKVTKMEAKVSKIPPKWTPKTPKMEPTTLTDDSTKQTRTLQEKNGVSFV